MDENTECLQTLIVIKDRVREFNEMQAEQRGGYSYRASLAEFPPIEYYRISVNEDQVEFEALWYRLSPEIELSLITEEERVLLSETILKMSYDYRSFFITQDSITIAYANSGNTALGLVNPAVNTEDPGIYSGGGIIDFTEPVNDDWCIIVQNYT